MIFIYEVLNQSGELASLLLKATTTKLNPLLSIMTPGQPTSLELSQDLTFIYPFYI
jgi:hypothetical protein